MSGYDTESLEGSHVGDRGVDPRSNSQSHGYVGGSVIARLANWTMQWRSVTALLVIFGWQKGEASQNSA